MKTDYIQSLTAFVLLFVLLPQATSGAANLLQTFNDPTVTNFDSFGTSVAFDGNHVLIGAPFDDTNGTDVGQAHLFDAVTGNLLQTFNDPTITSSDNFGRSVAIDGNHVLVGAYADDTNGSFVGQAHLFDAVTGNLLQTFNDPTVTNSDLFGVSVAIDGNHVLVGASGDETNGSNIGQAHLFDAVTGNFLQTFNDPTISLNDFFGSSVAIDGNHVLVGASGDDTNGTNVGQAHLFDAVTGNLLQTFNDPTVTDNDFFGQSVAIDGNHVLVGASRDDTNGTNVGQAHLFDAVTGNLLQTFNDPTITSSDNFGRSVAIDGNHVLVGAYADDTNGTSVGQAYLFDAVTGNLLQTFNDPTITSLDDFGYSVAIDGNHVLVGAYRDDTNGTNVGQAHLFEIFETEDLNQDGFVDSLDLGILLSNWNQSTTPDMGELDGTPPVDGLDLGILLAAWNPPPLAAAAQIPEPSTILLTIFGLVGLLTHRSVFNL